VIILLLENPAPADFDMDLADFVRRLSVPVIAAVNKMDGEKQLENMANFYEMGLQDIVPVSAKTHFNLALLLDKIIGLLPAKRTIRHESDLKITIVGRPNSGKSTLLNSFIGYNRSVVSEIPGTTRDSVDEEFMYRRKRITVIDTAGIRKKSRIKEHIEYYSLDRTRQAIERCDVAVHLIDAPAGLTDTDKKISDEIMLLKKPAIIAINKWDLIEKDHATFKSFTDRLIFRFYKAADFPIIAVSAKNKLRLLRIIDTAMRLKETSHRTIETSTLNRIIVGAASRQTPQNRGAIKIYYATQVGTAPPRFRFFVNNPAHFRKDTVRYFEKLLQRELDYKGVPVVIQIQGKK
jgi:GTP-binding protein